MAYTLGRFAVDEVGFIQTIPVRILVAAAQGLLDLNLLAREELVNRGYDQRGVWVGFERANAALEAVRAHGPSSESDAADDGATTRSNLAPRKKAPGRRPR